MNAPAAATRIDVSTVERFLIHEARLLDERRFEEWMALFVEDGYYWAPARPGQSDPLNEVSLIFDTPDIMRNRIQRLQHPKIHAQIPPSRSVRQVANVGIEEEDPASAELTVRSVFFLYEYRPTLPEPLARVFAGEYYHRLRVSGDGFRIVWKKAMLVNCDAALEALFVYF
jgi:3-phenylpropionate/cinnamic acid dioxygenase small subunit